MFFCEIPLSKLILLSTFLSLITFGSGQRCTQRRYIQKTRLKPVQRIENYWTQNWLGFNVQKTRHRWDYVTEHFTVPQLESVCCEGYIERFSECEPICIPECPEKSICTSPNTCTCNFGYTSITSSSRFVSCKPFCPAGCPANSSCTNPFKCTCDEGYRTRADGSCEPICSTQCPAHSSCIAPETCNCEAGYKRTVDGFECVPECKYGCPINMYCKAPNECACRFGYTARSSTAIESKEEQTTLESSDECIPVCSEGCPAQSKCIAPEQCLCEEGYQMINGNDDDNEASANTTICAPICEQNCPLHASCMRPNHCECAPGYELHNPPQHHPYCKAQCEQNCTINGKCVAPNVCECFDGYEHVNSTIGTTSTTEPPYCQPKCTKGCPHGICFAPEICVCKPGYLMGARGVCEPICTKSCQHGHCVEPEICVCEEGYQLSAHDYSKCDPICNETCINAVCAAPDICLCRDKYKPKYDENSGTLSPHECEPMCMAECVNADCIAPDQCQCHEGYVTLTNTSQSYICGPLCAGGCVNGICLAPEVCACVEGFELSSKAEGGTECVPITTTSITSESAMDSSAKESSLTTTPTTTTTEFKSITNNEEWFTNGFMPESLTTIADEHNTAALLTEQNLEKCNELCYCWKDVKNDSEKLCKEICNSHNDTCLHSKFIYCNETEKRLEYRYGDLIQIFVCGVNRTSTNYAKSEGKKAEPTWLLITGSILIILLTVAIAFLCVRIYQTRHETGAHEIPIRLLMKL